MKGIDLRPVLLASGFQTVFFPWHCLYRCANSGLYNYLCSYQFIEVLQFFKFVYGIVFLFILVDVFLNFVVVFWFLSLM